jgi:uridine kinase
VFDCVNKTNIAGRHVGESTENGIWLFFDKAIREKEHWDNIFVYSDMQAGHGGLYGINQMQYKKYCINGRYIDVAMLINEYRKTVNPNVMVYLVQTAGYSDALVPEFYDKTFIIGGWSTGILSFAHNMNEVFCGQN